MFVGITHQIVLAGANDKVLGGVFFTCILHNAACVRGNQSKERLFLASKAFLSCPSDDISGTHLQYQTKYLSLSFQEQSSSRHDFSISPPIAPTSGRGYQSLLSRRTRVKLGVAEREG